MLGQLLLKEKSSIFRNIDAFSKVLKQQQPKNSRSGIRIKKDYRTVFLCGANRADGRPSLRREELKKFIEKTCRFKVIYAETVFDELRKHSNNKNILSIEGDIASLADAIIIIVESPGAICELGAFSNSELTNKIFVINDVKYIDSQSFINAGPVALIDEINGSARTFWYNMSNDGVEYVDSIGSIFSDLKGALDALHPKRGGAGNVSSDIALMKWSSKDRLTLEHLYFAHDIIFFCGPLEHNEIIDIFKFIYRGLENMNFDGVKYAVGMLRSLGLIQTFQNGSKYFNWSTGKEAILYYHGVNVRKLACVFRIHHLRYNGERLDVCLGKTDR